MGWMNAEKMEKGVRKEKKGEDEGDERRGVEKERCIRRARG
jgi:hypothetical protein